MFFPNAGVVVDPVLLVLLGLIVGTLGGFFGVGGGFLITGGLLVFGVPPIFAVGTGLTLVMGSSIINMLKHKGLGHVDFRLGLLMVCGTVPGEILAERLNVALDEAGIIGPVIRYVYVIFLGALGSFIVYDYFKVRRRSGGTGDATSTESLARKVQSLRIPPHSIWLPGLGGILAIATRRKVTPCRSTGQAGLNGGRPRRVSTRVSLPLSEIQSISVFVPFTIGFGVGFMAGLLGAGGGFILMPLLVYVVGVPTTIAIGTDLFQIIITGSVGTFIYALGNHVDLLMAMIMLAAASVGSQIGATATRFVDSGRIRVLFGVTVLSGGVAVALKEVSESVSRLHFLDTVASALLLGVSGAICLVIAGLLLRAARRKPLAQGVEA